MDPSNSLVPVEIQCPDTALNGVHSVLSNRRGHVFSEVPRDGVSTHIFSLLRLFIYTHTVYPYIDAPLHCKGIPSRHGILRVQQRSQKSNERTSVPSIDV